MARNAAVVSAALVALCVAVRADAQYFGRNKVHYDRLEFRLLQTEHFDIHYYEEEEDATRLAARMAERWYARFSTLLGHQFSRRQPLVLYASHPHFSQTNLTAGAPGEGTGGFTERRKSRIAMPFAMGLGETDHVLGHEIAHAFQIDIARSVGQDAFRLPGWFIEGMAEYLSLGAADTHTLMWVRDAARHGTLPALDALDDPRVFPYRYGHALWSYLTGEYGDAIIGAVLRSKSRKGVLGRLEEATGLDDAELTQAWHASIAVPPQADAAPAAAALAAAGTGRINVGPSLSPDGRFVMFLSERDRLSLDLFLAEADSGKVVRKIISTAADPHFDSLQYIHSSGAWDRTGRRFAISALRRGEPVLVVVDVESGRREELAPDGVREIYNPSWSPDGTRIVFAALSGGLSDLFVYSLPEATTTRLTRDAFAELHPAWSPDGRTIAFATDRFTSTLTALQFGRLRIALLDVDSGLVRALPGAAAADPGKAKQINPQWSPAGDAVYFVGDRDGTNNVYQAELASGTLRQVSHAAGVSGITATSPALAVAGSAGTLAFSALENGRYAIRLMDGCGRGAGCQEAAALAPAAGEPLPASGDADAAAPTLARMLAAPRDGLPDGSAFTTARYDDRLQLESVAQPFVGASTATAFGSALRASFGVTFGDLLRDRQLQAAIRAGTDIDDFAAQVAYINRRNQWNWGVTAGFVPSRFYGARRSISRDADLVFRETTHLRYLHQWASFAGHYNINRAQRIELGAGVRRIGFDWQHVTRVLDGSGTLVRRDLTETPAGKPVYLAELQTAFVHDTAILGPTSPVFGQRLRLDIEPALGALTYADVRVDARRYFMPVKPVTIAARVQHVGRYGPGADDGRLTPLVLGLQSLVRGYDLRTFAIDECGREATECSLMGELAGSRLALFNLELRAPLLGLLTGDLDYGALPIEAIAFADAGFLWTRQADGAIERDRFRSVGAGARARLAGMVVEMAAARPFDRSAGGWTVSFLLRPGW